MNTLHPKHSDQEKGQRLAPESISLWIDSYSDIFSDFDPRPFSERAVSDDFISQVKKVSRDTTEKIDVLKILVPAGNRKDEYERTIRKRMENYFGTIHQQLQKEFNQTKRKGIYYVLTGITFMIIASYIAFLKPSQFYFNLLLVLFEPGGWFLLWSGLDALFGYSKINKKEIDFYNRIADTHIEFISYK